LTIAAPLAAPEQRLYRLLSEAHGDAAHARYNALIRRLVSYERAAAAVGLVRMRKPADAERITRFMQALGAAAPDEGTCYLIGGGTAVLLGWRETTFAVDVELDPEQDELLGALPAIKDALQINVELASPRHFIPLPAGWQERSPPVGREGRLTFRHFDVVSQALAKLERGHERDLEDARAMVDRGLVERARLREAFEEIEPELYRFPAIDPGDFERRVEDFLS
jgi:hypothetical protein